MGSRRRYAERIYGFEFVEIERSLHRLSYEIDTTGTPSTKHPSAWC